MDFNILLIIILSILPISELRGGIPLGIVYANQNNLPVIWPIILAIFSNILAIFIAFYFLEKVHSLLIKNRIYKKIFDKYIEKLQKKVDKFEKQYSSLGFVALALFVAIPLPATGAWSGVLISWLLKLDKKKSIISIALGVIIAGILVSLASLGIITFLS
jgi:uncharacterized membrane protein